MEFNKLNREGVKSIIFDLGGVLLNIDYNLTVKAFEVLGLTNFENVFSQYEQSSISDEFEKGNITSEEFFQHITKHHNINRNDFYAAWNALLLDFPKERFELLKILKQDFDLYLCSNTNAVHYDEFRTTVNQFGVDFDSLFNKVYYSHLVNDRKPNDSIFEMILKDNSLKANECLFIDDSVQHIKSAKAIGLQTVLAKEVTVQEIFADWLN